MEQHSHGGEQGAREGQVNRDGIPAIFGQIYEPFSRHLLLARAMHCMIAANLNWEGHFAPGL